MIPADFGAFCQQVHGWDPFPWQEDLLRQVLDQGWPPLVDIPTSLGKTAVLDVAVFAAALGADAARRRMFFIVDRRLVVDEAYDHAREIAAALETALESDPASIAGQVAAALHLQGDTEHSGDGSRRRVLDVTRMRGGVDWSWRWLERPDRHAIVVGTVDQVGSRLFFRGYGLGRNLRSIDAALVGTDSLIIVDEAHLSQAFLASACEALDSDARDSEMMPENSRPVIVSMSASPAGEERRGFTIKEADIGHPVGGKRLNALKRLHTVVVHGTKKSTGSAVPEAMAQWAEHLAADRGAVVVGTVCNTVARARAVFTLLNERHPGQCVLLTGRIRPVDREYLLREWYPKIKANRSLELTHPVFLVATQTVEVGANIDLDALISDSAPLASLIQRLGRLNRFGSHDTSTPAIIIHSDDDPPGVYGDARAATWELLTGLVPPVQWLPDKPLPDPGPGLAASPLALRELVSGLSRDEREIIRPSASYIPVMFPAHLDRWVQTSPEPRTDVPVAPFLHGIDSAPADVSVVWREIPDGADQVLAAQVLPPSADEAIELPLTAVRRWLARIDPAAGLTDLEGAAGEDVVPDAPPVPPAAAVQVVRYRDRENARLAGPDQIRPGDLIVVPASFGGCDRYGWNPASTTPVTDVADLARSGGRRAAIRLGPSLRKAVAEHDPGFADRWLRPLVDEVGADLAAGELKQEKEYCSEIGRILSRSRAPKTGPLPPHLAVLRALAAPRSPVLDVHHQFGWVILTGDKTSFGEDTGERGSSIAGQQVDLMTHQQDVQACAQLFARNLGLADAAVTAVGLAALWHDEGKRDDRFQVMLHGGDRILAAIADQPLAKSGMSPLDRRAFRQAREDAGYPVGMRHEVLSAQIAAHLLRGRADVDRDLILHLVASHHGRSRPLFPPVTEDPAPVTLVGGPHGSGDLTVDSSESVDWSAPGRFATLNDRYGRWGLARMEAIVRLADIWCSARGEPPGGTRGTAAGPVTLVQAEAVAAWLHAVELPALDGRDPLGFLAALGLLCILTLDAGMPARLAFSPQNGTAILESPLASTEAISQQLREVVAAIPRGAVLPATGPGFPPPAGVGKDPLRPLRLEYGNEMARFLDEHPAAARAWLPVLVTDLAEDKYGRAALTPFTAPSGQQKIRTFFEKPLEVVTAQPRYLDQALTAWQRVEGFTGEYLDHRVLRSAADDVHGRTGRETGVPGATWLATMALRLLSHAGDGTWPRTVLWYRAGRRHQMKWPLWSRPLDLPAVTCLIDHHKLREATASNGNSELAALGVFAVCAAERQRIPGRNFDGVLAPVTGSVR